MIDMRTFGGWIVEMVGRYIVLLLWAWLVLPWMVRNSLFYKHDAIWWGIVKGLQYAVVAAGVMTVVVIVIRAVEWRNRSKRQIARL